MRRAQYYFFASPPLRLMWLIAGYFLWARRHRFLSVVSRVRRAVVAVCGNLRTYAYGQLVSISWDRGVETVGKVALHDVLS